jgi:hypothetical protein
MITARNLLSSFAALRARAEAIAEEFGTWVRNEDGMYTVEWVLVIIAVLHTLVWPMYLVMQKLTFYYESPAGPWASRSRRQQAARRSRGPRDT